MVTALARIPAAANQHSMSCCWQPSKQYDWKGPIGKQGIGGGSSDISTPYPSPPQTHTQHSTTGMAWATVGRSRWHQRVMRQMNSSPPSILLEKQQPYCAPRRVKGHRSTPSCIIHPALHGKLHPQHWFQTQLGVETSIKPLVGILSNARLKLEWHP